MIIPFGNLKTSTDQGNRFEAVKDFRLTGGIRLPSGSEVRGRGHWAKGFNDWPEPPLSFCLSLLLFNSYLSCPWIWRVGQRDLPTDSCQRGRDVFRIESLCLRETYDIVAMTLFPGANLSAACKPAASCRPAHPLSQETWGTHMLLGRNDMNTTSVSTHWIIKQILKMWIGWATFTDEVEKSIKKEKKNDFIRKNGLKIINQSECIS